MAERQLTGEELFSQRPEYRRNVSELRMLKHAALTSIEEILAAEEAEKKFGIAYATSSEVVSRQLVLTRIEQLDDEMFFSGDDMPVSVRLGRAAVFTDVTIRADAYRTGSLSESINVVVQDFVEESQYPFISNYMFERFAGGSVVASVARTDVLKERGLDEREMLPYDFREFEMQLRVIDALLSDFAIDNATRKEG